MVVRKSHYTPGLVSQHTIWEPLIHTHLCTPYTHTCHCLSSVFICPVLLCSTVGDSSPL